MMKVLLATSLLILCQLESNCAVVPNSPQSQRAIYQERIQILHNLLSKECPNTVKLTHQRSPSLNVQRTLLTTMVVILTSCRKDQTSQMQTISHEQTTASSTKIEPLPAMLISIKRTNMSHPTPSKAAKSLHMPTECLTATNITNSERTDRLGHDLRPGGPYSQQGYACDFHRDLQWFRFTAHAGTRMLNSCPKVKSCGTYGPYWTDAAMPATVGVSVRVNAYRVFSNDSNHCKSSPLPLEVMRCSWDTNHDFIYRQNTLYSKGCSRAYCGMM